MPLSPETIRYLKTAALKLSEEIREVEVLMRNKQEDLKNATKHLELATQRRDALVAQRTALFNDAQAAEKKEPPA